MTTRDRCANDRPIVLATTATVVGGLWRHMRDLGEGLTRRGRNVSIALPPRASTLAQLARGAGFDVVGLGQRVPGAVWHLHLGNTYDRSALGHLLRARRRYSAVVLTEHLPRTDASDVALAGRAPRQGAWTAKTLLKQAHFALAHRVIAVSQGSREFLLTRYGLSPARVHAVQNALRTRESGAGAGSRSYPAERLQSGREETNGTRVVAVGSLIRQKGFDILVGAARASNADWSVHIFGDGPHHSALVATVAADATIAHRVRFRGWTDNPSKAFAEADVAVVPSRWEACPYVALEAMEAGLPVVATRVDGLSDIVLHNHTGVLVPPEQPSALAEALDALACRPDLATTMGMNGRRRLQEQYSLARMVDSTIHVYEEAVQCGG